MRPYSNSQRTFSNRGKNNLSLSLNKKSFRGNSSYMQRTNPNNKILIVSKDKQKMSSTSKSFNRNKLRNIFLDSEYENDDEDLKEIKNLWYDLGINKEYQDQFIHMIFDLNENDKEQFYNEEKKKFSNF